MGNATGKQASIDNVPPSCKLLVARPSRGPKIPRRLQRRLQKARYAFSDTTSWNLE
jgi:hypothetical protein